MRPYFFRMKLLALSIVLVASNVSPTQAKQEVSPSDSLLFFNGMTTDLLRDDLSLSKHLSTSDLLAQNIPDSTKKAIKRAQEAAEAVKRKKEEAENRKKQKEQREAAEREEKKKAAERERKRQLTQEQRDAEKAAEQRKAADREEKKKAEERERKKRIAEQQAAAAEKARCDAGQGVVKFYPGEQDKVLDWINHQFVFRTTPYCYRNSYDRGVGIVPETRCANGRDRYGALCYNKCPGGYVRQDAGGSNFACVKSCPSGYRKTIQNICEIEKAQRNCRWACKGGWREVSGGGCRKNGTALFNAKTCYCPDKYNNMGANCQIDPKYQNITMPYAGGQSNQRRYTDPYPLVNYCKSNRELQAGMCYNNCRANYHGLVTACWQNCQPGKVECAAGCASSKTDCAMSTLNQVMSVALVANAIYAKYAEAYPAATKAASEMTVIEKAMARFTEALTEFMAKNAQSINTFSDLKLAGNLGLELATAIEDLITASNSTSLATLIDKQDYDELVKVINPKSQAYKSLTKAWVTHYIQMTLVNAGLTIGKTLLTAVDETGIVFLVDSYAKPICTVPEPFPISKRQAKGC